MESLARFIQATVAARAGTILAAAGILLGASAWIAAERLYLDTSLENFLLQNDPEHQRNLEIKEEFSNDEILVIAFDLGRPFSPDDLRTLRNLHKRISSINNVEDVIDLATIADVRGDGEILDASPLVDWESIDAEIELIRRRVSSHPIYSDNLVSLDGQVLGMLVIPAIGDKGDLVNFQVTDDVMRILKTDAPPWPTYVSGYPAAEYEGNRTMTRDLLVLTGTALLVLALLVFLAVRRAFAVVFVVSLVLWSELITLGWFGLSRTPLTMVTAIVPAVLLATSATYGIYLIGLLQVASRAPNPGLAVIPLILRPALVSALSTAIGFLSLRVMPVAALRQLGTSLAIGIIAAFIGTLFILPAIIHRWRLRIDFLPPKNLDRWITIGTRLAKRPRLTAIIGIAIAGVAALGVARIQLDSDPLNYFRKDSFHRSSDRFIRQNLSGTLLVNVIVHGEGAGGALEPDVLRFTQSLIEELNASPIVDRAVSFLDYLWLMDAAMEPDRIPLSRWPSRPIAEQYMFLYEAGGDPSDYAHYINHDRSALNVFVRVNSRSSSDVLALRDRVYEFASSNDGAPKTEVLGSWLLFPKAMDTIARSMVNGLIIAMGLILIVMAVTLRSAKLGIVAVIPNALPIVICTGMLGWLGIPLSFGTCIVGCVALGLAVDDTAHVLGHVRADDSLDRVYETVGRPLILTTAILGCGFAILGWSHFQPVVHLGLATSATLLVALACDLLLLPSLLALAGWKATEHSSPNQTS